MAYLQQMFSLIFTWDFPDLLVVLFSCKFWQSFQECPLGGSGVAPLPADPLPEPHPPQNPATDSPPPE